MSASSATAFTIVHRKGQKSETVASNLSSSDAREWLRKKAAEIQAQLNEDLIVKAGNSEESWAAVESE